MKQKVNLLLTFLCLAISATGQHKEGLKHVEGKIKANGIFIAYEIFEPENKQTILLIAGTGSQLTDWPAAICTKLALKGYRVIRFDNRDVGLSSRFDSLGAPDWVKIFPKIKTCDTVGLPYTIQSMAQDAVGLLDVLKIKKAHVVGASMGGAIAQIMAINFPERILSLSCIGASSGDPNLPSGDPKVLAIMGTPPPTDTSVGARANYLVNIYKAMENSSQLTPDSVLFAMATRNVKRSWHPEGVARQAAAILIADNCDRRNSLKNVNIPSVVIHGDRDPVVNIAAAKQINAAIIGSTLIILPGMGHSLSSTFHDRLVEGILLAVRNNNEARENLPLL
jgi:pimeloyl-ACP methyl ester carboxylesterase